MEINGLVVNGKFVPDTLESGKYKSVLQDYEGKKVVMNIVKLRDKITNAQRKYYFGGLLGPAVEILSSKNFTYQVTGYSGKKKVMNTKLIDKDFLHKRLKAKFFGMIIEDNTGNLLVEIPSITKWKTDEMAFYIELVRTYLAQPDNEWNTPIYTLSSEDYLAAEAEKWIR